MSTNVPMSERLVFLLPEEIVVDDEILKARPLYDLDQEQQEIEDLAKSIEQNGQIEPIVVRWELSDVVINQGHYHLIAGRRRRDAVMFINAGKSSKDKPFKLSAVIKQDVMTRDDAFKMALQENLKRKNLNPIQNAMVIKELRDKFGWADKKGTKKVAEFLQVSPAFVTTHEKLLTLTVQDQAKVARGELSAQAAFELLNTVPEKRDEVERRAQELQQGEESAHQDDQNAATDQPDGKKGQNKGKKKALKAKHVRTASREHAAAISLRPLNRAEIVEFFVKVQSPAYGHPNGSIHIFAKSFVMWTEGKLKDETLKKHFDSMVVKADRGKAVKPQKEEKPAKKKTAAKPKK